LAKKELIIPGSYADKDISTGSIYHTIYYGKNAMGSYANQLNEKERWEVVDYVMELKAALEK
jgi:mono/diheme cytochrome c family protein